MSLKIVVCVKTIIQLINRDCMILFFAERCPKMGEQVRLDLKLLKY